MGKNSENNSIKISGGKSTVISTVDPGTTIDYPGASPDLPLNESSDLLSVTDGLVLHLRADKYVNTVVNKKVTSWKDLSGNENDFGNATDSTRPVVSESIKNGRDVVKFIQNDQTVLQALPVLSSSQQGEMFVVLRVEDDAVQNAWMRFNSSSAVNYYPTGSNIVDGFGLATPKTYNESDTSLLNLWHVVNISISSSLSGDPSTTYTTKISGTQIYTSTTESTIQWATDAWTLGKSLAGNAGMLVGEVLLYDRVLTAAEKNTVVTNLQRGWGIAPSSSLVAFFSGSSYLYNNVKQAYGLVDDLTIETYINVAATGSKPTIASQYENGAGKSYRFFHDSETNKLNFEFYPGNMLSSSLFCSGTALGSVYHNDRSALISANKTIETLVNFKDTTKESHLLSKFNSNNNLLYDDLYYDPQTQRLVFRHNSFVGYNSLFISGGNEYVFVNDESRLNALLENTNQAYYLSSSNYLYVNDPSTFYSPSREMTVEGYFNFESFNQKNTFVSKFLSSSAGPQNLSYQFYYDSANNNLVFEHKNLLGDYCLHLSGGSDYNYVFINNKSFLQFQGTGLPQTIECYVKFDSVNDKSTFAAKFLSGTQTTKLAYWFYHDGTTNDLAYTWDSQAGVGIANTSWTPEINKWYHLAISRNNFLDVNFYVDGQLLATVLGTPGYEDTKNGIVGRFTIGNIESGTQETQLVGSINNVRIWDIVRTPSLIQTFTTSSLAPAAEWTADAQGLWFFENTLAESKQNYNLTSSLAFPGLAHFENAHIKTTASFTAAANTWYHLAATYENLPSASIVSILKGGTPLVVHTASHGGGDCTGIYFSGSNTLNFTVGNIESGSLTTQFSGTVDDIRYWDIVRSPTQIASTSGSDYTTYGNNLSGNFRFQGDLVNEAGLGLSSWDLSSAQPSLDLFITSSDYNIITFAGQTIECYACFRDITTSATSTLVAKYDSNETHQDGINYWFYYCNGKLGYKWVSNGTAYEAVGTFAPTLNKWYHLASTADVVGADAVVSLYVDGKTVLSASTISGGGGASPFENSGLSRFTIGNIESGSTTTALSGYIDEVRTWSGVKNQAHIYDYIFRPLTSSATNLDTYYRFENNLDDSTTSANHLTASSGAEIYRNPMTSSTPFTPDKDQWYHIAVTKENGPVIQAWPPTGLTDSKDSIIKIFVDSQLLSEVTSSYGGGFISGTDYARFTIGNIESGSATTALSGYVDEVRIWSIAKEHSYFVSGKDVPLVGNEVGLEAYYKFEGNLLDETANSIDLVNNGGACFERRSVIVTASYTPTLNSWEHVAATRKNQGTASAVAIYVGGTPITVYTASYSGDALSASDNIRFTVGNIESGSSATSFSGSMDETRFWNVVRTITEIPSTLAAPFTGTANNLTASYLFDSDFTDSTALSNDLTSSNGTVVFTADNPGKYLNRLNDDGN